MCMKLLTDWQTDLSVDWLEKYRGLFHTGKLILSVDGQLTYYFFKLTCWLLRWFFSSFKSYQFDLSADHLADNQLITWLTISWSLGWRSADHLDDHQLITWLNISCHLADNQLITWLTINWSLGWRSADHLADNQLITWLTISWSLDWTSADHLADNQLITWLTVSWSSG